jgi:type II secretory pathway component PulM
MSAGMLLAAGLALTVLVYLGYLYGAPARRAHWRLIAEERRRLWAARQILERQVRDRRHPDDTAELADYLRER